MKYFNAKLMKPDISQFHEIVNNKLSEAAPKSIAYRSILNLFTQAQTLYRNLDFVSSDNLSHLKAANKTITHRQEADAIALTALHVSSLLTSTLNELITQDPTLTDSDRVVLTMTLDLYKSTCAATCAALGHPRWID